MLTPTETASELTATADMAKALGKRLDRLFERATPDIAVRLDGCAALEFADGAMASAARTMAGEIEAEETDRTTVRLRGQATEQLMLQAETL